MSRSHISKPEVGKALISAMAQLQKQEGKAFDQLLNNLGNTQQKAYVYYLPSLIENLKDKLLGKGVDFNESITQDASHLLHTLSKIGQVAEQVIDSHGGHAKLEQTYGTDFVNAREACVAVTKMSAEDLRSPASLNVHADGNSLTLKKSEAGVA